MKYIECPDIYEGSLKRLFIAGGITGCSDWQKDLVSLLQPINIAVFNPRRANFPINDPTAAESQIIWEHTQMKNADFISFWFCPETLNPIVLYELGYWMKSEKPIVIGAHLEYKRLTDVIIQTRLARPNLKVVNTIEGLAAQIVNTIRA